jgi:hypothetical protein
VAKTPAFKVTPSAGAGGSMNPPDALTVYSGSSTSFTLMPATGYQISDASGCGGTLSGSIFTTGTIGADCTVTASFSKIQEPVQPATPSEASASSSDTNQTATTTSSGNMGSLLNQAAAQQAAQQAAAQQAAAQQAANTAAGSGNTVPSGIITGPGKTKPDITDAMRAIRIAIGLDTPTAADLANGDVAPLVHGKPAPDGKIGIDDAILILRKSVGLVSW